jgi:hypothetical protein
MPARYEVMRDKFAKGGMSMQAAKGKAARIFNATRKPGEEPVTRGSDTNLHRKVKKGLKRAFPD